MQKRVGLHRHGDDIALAHDFDELHLPSRVRGLAVHRAERGEIVLAQQTLRCAMHGVCIERPPLPSQVLSAQRRPHVMVEQAIAIAPRARRKPGIERIAHRHTPAHAHGGRQARGRAQHPGARIALRVAVEIHDLAFGMHTGIGTPRARHHHRMAGDPRQGVFKRYLQRPWPTLSTVRCEPLPTFEIAAVVFDA